MILHNILQTRDKSPDINASKVGRLIILNSQEVAQNGAFKLIENYSLIVPNPHLVIFILKGSNKRLTCLKKKHIFPCSS